MSRKATKAELDMYLRREDVVPLGDRLSNFVLAWLFIFLVCYGAWWLLIRPIL